MTHYVAFEDGQFVFGEMRPVPEPHLGIDEVRYLQPRSSSSRLFRAASHAAPPQDRRRASALVVRAVQLGGFQEMLALQPVYFLLTTWHNGQSGDAYASVNKKVSHRVISRLVEPGHAQGTTPARLGRLGCKVIDHASLTGGAFVGLLSRVSRTLEVRHD